MQFLKILFWCLLAFLAALFTIANWTSIPVHLPGDLVADINLPFLLLVTFLLGLLPTLGWQAARRWRLRQRLTTCERQLAEARALHAAIEPVTLPATIAEPAVTPLSPSTGATL